MLHLIFDFLDEFRFKIVSICVSAKVARPTLRQPLQTVIHVPRESPGFNRIETSLRSMLVGELQLTNILTSAGHVIPILAKCNLFAGSQLARWMF